MTEVSISRPASGGTVVPVSRFGTIRHTSSLGASQTSHTPRNIVFTATPPVAHSRIELLKISSSIGSRKYLHIRTSRSGVKVTINRILLIKEF